MTVGTVPVYTQTRRYGQGGVGWRAFPRQVPLPFCGSVCAPVLRRSTCVGLPDPACYHRSTLSNAGRLCGHTLTHTHLYTDETRCDPMTTKVYSGFVLPSDRTDRYSIEEAHDIAERVYTKYGPVLAQAAQFHDVPAHWLVGLTAVENPGCYEWPSTRSVRRQLPVEAWLGMVLEGNPLRPSFDGVKMRHLAGVSSTALPALSNLYGQTMLPGYYVLTRFGVPIGEILPPSLLGTWGGNDRPTLTHLRDPQLHYFFAAYLLALEPDLRAQLGVYKSALEPEYEEDGEGQLQPGDPPDPVWVSEQEKGAYANVVCLWNGKHGPKTEARRHNAWLVAQMYLGIEQEHEPGHLNPYRPKGRFDVSPEAFAERLTALDREARASCDPGGAINKSLVSSDRPTPVDAGQLSYQQAHALGERVAHRLDIFDAGLAREEDGMRPNRLFEPDDKETGATPQQAFDPTILTNVLEAALKPGHKTTEGAMLAVLFAVLGIATALNWVSPTQANDVKAQLGNLAPLLIFVPVLWHFITSRGKIKSNALRATIPEVAPAIQGFGGFGKLGKILTDSRVRTGLEIGGALGVPGAGAAGSALDRVTGATTQSSRYSDEILTHNFQRLTERLTAAEADLQRRSEEAGHNADGYDREFKHIEEYLNDISQALFVLARRAGIHYASDNLKASDAVKRLAYTVEVANDPKGQGQER